MKIECFLSIPFWYVHFFLSSDIRQWYSIYMVVVWLYWVIPLDLLGTNAHVDRNEKMSKRETAKEINLNANTQQQQQQHQNYILDGFNVTLISRYCIAYGKFHFTVTTQTECLYDEHKILWMNFSCILHRSILFPFFPTPLLFLCYFHFVPFVCLCIIFRFFFRLKIH